MKHELKPLEAPFPGDIEEILAKYPKNDGYLLQLFRVFANSKRFLKNTGAKNLLDKDSPLSLREREIIILRLCAQLNCEYEWGVHATVFAQAAELKPAQVEATRLGSGQESCWSEREQCLIQVVDQLANKAVIDGDSYAQFQQLWDKDQQLEIFALCGNYHLVAFVANCSGLEPEPFAARFPDSR